VKNGARKVQNRGKKVTKNSINFGKMCSKNTIEKNFSYRFSIICRKFIKNIFSVCFFFLLLPPKSDKKLTKLVSKT